MSIHVLCSCGKEFWVPDDWGGKRGRCPVCRGQVSIPDPRAAADLVVEEDEGAPEALVEEEEEDAGYALTEESANLADRLPGEGGGYGFGGEVGLYRLVPQDGVVTCVAFSPNGAYGLAGLEDEIYVLNLRTGRKAYRFRGHKEQVRCLAVSPDGQLVASGDQDGGLLLWEQVERGRPLRWLEGHDGAVTSVAYAAHGYYVLSGGEDATARLWDVASGREIGRYREHDPVAAVALSPDGRLVLTGSDNAGVCLWQVETGRLLKELKADELGPIRCVAFSRDGERALAAGAAGGISVAHWDVQRGKRLVCFEDKRVGKLPGVHRVAFSPDGEYLFGGGAPETRDVNFADHQAADPMRSTAGYRVGGEAVVLGTLMGARGVAASVRYTLTTTPLSLWRLETGIRLKSFIGHKGRRGAAKITCAAVSAEGRRALSGANDGRVHLWSLF